MANLTERNIPLCSPITCKDVFNPNVTTFQPNCAEGLHFRAFHYCCACSKNQSVVILSGCIHNLQHTATVSVSPHVHSMHVH